MDLHAVRVDLATAVAACVSTSLAYVPDDVPEFPAAIVGMPRSIKYGATLGLALVVLPVTLVVEASDIERAQKEMDALLSTSGDKSVVAAVKAATSSAWQKANVVEQIDAARSVTVGNTKTIAVDVLVEVRSTK